MKCMEPGVLECSDYYFSTPSGIAKKTIFLWNLLRRIQL